MVVPIIPWNRMREFEPGILQAINDGVDKDTVGAVAGAILGAYWGEIGIPKKWRTHVAKGVEIAGLANEVILAANMGLV